MPNKMIAYEIAKHTLLIIFDEYGTSKFCPVPICDGLMIDKSRKGGNRVRVCSVCGLECERDNSACQSGLSILSATSSGKKKDEKVKVNPKLWPEKFLRSKKKSNTTTKKRKGDVSKKQDDKKKKKQKECETNKRKGRVSEKQATKKKTTENDSDYDSDFTAESNSDFVRWKKSKKNAV